MEQRSEAWFDARTGRITASRMSDVMAFTVGEGVWKSGPRKGQAKVSVPLKARTDYIHQLAAERITGKPRKQVKAWALQWGQDVEPAAQAAYEAETGVIVERCGFVIHPAYDFIGASPDFQVGEAGGGEIKCPESSEVHLTTLADGLPSEHVEQIQGGLWVTGRQWWDFVSFHPDFPPHLRLYIQRVERDEPYIAKLADACISLDAEVRAIVDQLNHKEAA
ncbi:lambda exonuclease family protein [Lysobacter capsici]|uniref:lambda exonuclease family protein n=1 Tax=Lysobacter capsici TaxID=435897 RepID=UPI00287B9E63|nr:YqaJ viral recombinase family protein [Lysobacter capsici]WND79429.1 YqaJ viral recombinase family protein [Lysobacter capsici]WND84625.1 YqaJ viral recombinase family protein [Lysobacter capsici]